jgi:hypothetical protein
MKIRSRSSRTNSCDGLQEMAAASAVATALPPNRRLKRFRSSDTASVTYFNNSHRRLYPHPHSNNDNTNEQNADEGIRSGNNTQSQHKDTYSVSTGTSCGRISSIATTTTTGRIRTSILILALLLVLCQLQMILQQRSVNVARDINTRSQQMPSQQNDAHTTTIATNLVHSTHLSQHVHTFSCEHYRRQCTIHSISQRTVSNSPIIIIQNQQ